MSYARDPTHQFRRRGRERRPRAGGRDPEGRAERGHHDGGGDRVAAFPSTGEEYGRHDGRSDLQGRVLPIGGLKQKVLAAHAAGLTEVIVPEHNEPDLDDVPSDVRSQMQFHIVGSVDQVLTLALEPRPLAMAA